MSTSCEELEVFHEVRCRGFLNADGQILALLRQLGPYSPPDLCSRTDNKHHPKEGLIQNIFPNVFPKQVQKRRASSQIIFPQKVQYRRVSFHRTYPKKPASPKMVMFRSHQITKHWESANMFRSLPCSLFFFEGGAGLRRRRRADGRD